LEWIDVSEMSTASTIRAIKSFNALMMEAVRISETSVHFNDTTRLYISEDSKVHNCSRENLKYHKGPLTMRHITLLLNIQNVLDIFAMC
jgi:hypothetical protein